MICKYCHNEYDENESIENEFCSQQCKEADEIKQKCLKNPCKEKERSTTQIYGGTDIHETKD